MLGPQKKEESKVRSRNRYTFGFQVKEAEEKEDSQCSLCSVICMPQTNKQGSRHFCKNEITKKSPEQP